MMNSSARPVYWPTATPPTTADTVLALIANRVPQHVAHLVTASARLIDLDMNPLDRYFSLPCDLEEKFGIEFADDVIEGWRTVQDVVSSTACGS